MLELQPKLRDGNFTQNIEYICVFTKKTLPLQRNIAMTS